MTPPICLPPSEPSRSTMCNGMWIRNCRKGTSENCTASTSSPCKSPSSDCSKSLFSGMPEPPISGNFVCWFSLSSSSLGKRQNNMLLIADSGSTKTDWRLVNEEGTTVRSIQSKGLNPYFLSEAEIAATIEEEVLPQLSQVDQVWFYGAGCGLPVKVQQVESAIASVIPSTLSPKVHGDMLGAARSLFQTQPGIACILGTGANSCVYDGQDIVDNVPSLGYILADWGSGTVLCKDLIALILQEKIDEKICSDFYRS